MADKKDLINALIMAGAVHFRPIMLTGSGCRGRLLCHALALRGSLKNEQIFSTIFFILLQLSELPTQCRQPHFYPFFTPSGAPFPEDSPAILCPSIYRF